MTHSDSEWDCYGHSDTEMVGRNPGIRGRAGRSRFKVVGKDLIFTHL